MDNEVKEPAPKYNYISPEEYLEMELAAEEKHEYYDGLIYAMAGASINHNRIAMNLYINAGPLVKAKGCEIFPSDQRMTTPSHDSYMYPDATIVCGKPQVQDKRSDTLLNPVVIIEILSLSTRSIDKQRKFFFYKEIPSLKEYIMIDSQKRQLIISRRQPDNTWQLEDIREAHAELHIHSIDTRLQIELLYDGTGL